MTVKKDSTKYYSNKQEKSVAKQLKGSTTIASGSLYFQKGDVRLDNFLIECKTTSKNYYSLSVKTWIKIQNESLKDGMRVPLMHIQLENGNDSYVVINIHDFNGFDVDDILFYGKVEQPLLIENKSFRLTNALKSYTLYDINTVKSMQQVPRLDIKFVDYNIHLVIISWEDFLYITINKKLINSLT